MSRKKAKRIIIDGHVFRWRRGVLVEVPSAWVGKTVAPQTINKRQSKAPRKLRRFVSSPGVNARPGEGSRTHARRKAIRDNE